MEDLSLLWAIFGVFHGLFLGAFAFGWNQSTRVFWMQFWGVMYAVLNLAAPIFSYVEVLPWFITQFVWASTATFLILCAISWLIYRRRKNGSGN